MAELIAIIILVLSLSGMGLLLYRKIPSLLELPENSTKVNLKVTSLGLGGKAVGVTPLKKVYSDIFLQKILSKVRVLSLKTDHKTSNWLQGIRKRSQKDKFREDDSYWKDIKNSTKR